MEFDLVGLQDADVARQPLRELRQHVADRQDAKERVEVFERARRADLHGEMTARFFIALRRRQGVVDAPDGPFVQHAGDMFGLEGVIGEQGPGDILAQGGDFGGHQIAGEPGPDRLERHARDAREAPVVGDIVDQKRLERREEQPLDVADARRLLPRGPDRAAQFLQHQFVAGALAAQHAALELGDEHRARLGFEGAQIIPQPFDGLPVARHGTRPRLDDTAPVLSAGRLRTGYVKRPEIGAISPPAGARGGLGAEPRGCVCKNLWERMAQL